MEHHESGTWLSGSFTDLMTSLAVIFILLLCATFNSVQQESETTRNSILVELQKSLSDFAPGGIEVKSEPKDPLGLLVLVPEDLLAFSLDKADISAKGFSFLRTFVPRLAKTVCSPHFVPEISSVVVEGHTDSSGTAEHNLDLSQKRSLAVVRESLHVLDDDRNSQEKSAFLQILSASGRGSAELITGPSGAENASLSRRVVFKIRVRSLEQRQLIEILQAKGA
jgi:outer membrane protein OmpA-like peptidoglycan-associated protein